ncbi:MAG: hypothetical protein NVSMB27_19180 [Ktedonobacteraceae bacterium]
MPLEGLYLGRYRLIRLIGSGGMGEVYLAEDDRIAQQVAIKVIRMEMTPYPDTRSTKEASRLFEREARAIARLDHPNILPLYAYGEETVNDETLTYLVMPYRKEGTLATWLRQRGATGLLSPREVAHLLTQASDALQHAHDQQILHQDIKPSNFLIRSRKDQLPDLLLADFGIARFTTATASVSQSIRGTPTYMAPEQWDGQPVTATDQYALAIMAYELLTGRPPFQGGPGQVMRQHYLTQPEPPSTLNAHLSPSLDEVLLRALAKQPEERYASITDFASAFEQAVRAAPAGAVPSPPSLPEDSTTLPQNGNDIHSDLAIHPTEAVTGTSRMLTLPGGQSTTVSVPAGAYDGQILRLEGLGEPSSAGGSPGALILTLVIQKAEEPDLTAHTASTEPTLLVSNPDLQTPSFQDTTAPDTPAWVEPAVETETAPHSEISTPDATVPASQPNLETLTRPAFASGPQESTILAASVTTHNAAGFVPDATRGTLPSRSRLGMSRGRMLLLIGAALLVVLGSVGIISTTIANQATNNAHATATAQVNATTTRVFLNGNASATAFIVAATAKAATAAAQAQAAATATITAQQNLYTQATSGTPALDDPLRDNSRGYNWDQGSLCYFGADGAYHAIAPHGARAYLSRCFAENTDFSNFALQVQMTYGSGFGGAIFFRATRGDLSQNPSGMYFSSGPGGSCRIGYDVPINVIDLADLPCVGLKQSNLITIIAKGDNYFVYVNRSYIGTVTDSTYHHGQIGFVSYYVSAMAFSNLKVWRL